MVKYQWVCLNGGRNPPDENVREQSSDKQQTNSGRSHPARGDWKCSWTASAVSRSVKFAEQVKYCLWRITSCLTEWWEWH